MKFIEPVPAYATGKVIAAVDPRFDSTSLTTQAAHLLFNGIEYESFRTIFHSPKAAKAKAEENILLIELMDKSPQAVLEAVRRLSSNPNILYAEPDYWENPHRIPNDPLYVRLWGAQKIKAPSAWNYTTGRDSTAVGVIDTCVDYRHPDIRRNMWASPNRRLHNGWSFAENTANPMDVNGHGSHVAGTIGAVGNNRIGISGICWNIKIAALKFGFDVASAIESIDFANHFQIPILNASWGGRFYSQALKQSIEQYQGLFIASAGNDGTNNDQDPVYPAAYDSGNIIAVAASAPDDTLARFSNYGITSVDIAAPGTDILSLDLQNDYSPLNGTSMAAPHVAGAAALLKSYRPGLSVSDLKQAILRSVAPKPALAGVVSTGGILDLASMFQLIQ